MAKARRSRGGDFIYRTTYLYEADLVANELEEASVPFYRAEEGPVGVRWAMPLSPSWEPGTCYLVVVPARQAKRARGIVSELPVSQEPYPGVWQPRMTDEDKKFWRWWAWFAIAMFAVGLIGAVAQVFWD